MRVPHLRSDRLANVFGILFYTPILLCLPLLLVVGVLFSYPRRLHYRAGRSLLRVGVVFTGLLGLAVSRRRRARGLAGAAERKLRERDAIGSIVIRFTASDRVAADSLRVSRNDPTVASAPNLVLSRRGSDEVNLVAARERGHVPDRQDGAPTA